MSQVIVVERAFAIPVGFAELQDRERGKGWCLEQHGVSPLHSFVAADGSAAMCLYRAPDAEAVRITQRTADLPFERVWPAIVIGGTATMSPHVLLAERSFEGPVTATHVVETIAGRGHCLQTHDVQHVASYLAGDGMRMICVFVAPDAEAVRTISRQIGMPVDRVWFGRAVV
jgi:hypothetical protein